MHLGQGFGFPFMRYPLQLRVQIGKDRPIKSLGSMSRGEIFEAFDMYIKRCKSSVLGGESCDM